MNIACAPSTETFKSRLIEAIRTGAIVVAPPRTVTTIHAGVGAPTGILRRATLGGIKKKPVIKIVHRFFYLLLLHYIILHIFYFVLYIFLYFTMH